MTNIVISPKRLRRNMKKLTFLNGGRRSGGEDLERKPLPVRIQVYQTYENIRFYTSDDFA